MAGYGGEMTPGARVRLEAAVQRIGEEMVIDAVIDLAHDRMGQMEHLEEIDESWNDYTEDEMNQAADALTAFFAEVAVRLERNRGYRQPPRVKLAKVSVVPGQ